MSSRYEYMMSVAVAARKAAAGQPLTVLERARLAPLSGPEAYKRLARVMLQLAALEREAFAGS